MGLHHRKIQEEICTLVCHLKDSSFSHADGHTCVESCTNVTTPIYFPPPSPPIYIDPDLGTPSKAHQISIVLILVVSFLAVAFFAVCCYALYAGFFRKRRSSPETEEENTRGDFLDGEHGPMLDHPIWYIRTTGLQQSVISAITICKYKKGEGLIDGTECSVCLSEFEEDENLRLLPKCNHAFHLPCIDTWLRSHTNCPMCRAPIVLNPTTVIATPEPNLVNSSNTEETRIEILENRNENAQNSVSEARNGDDERGREMVVEDRSESENFFQERRRSVSLDLSSVEKINRALAVSMESSSPSKRVSKGSSSSFRIRSFRSVAGTSMKRTRSHSISSLYSRSQRKPSVPLRSF